MSVRAFVMRERIRGMDDMIRLGLIVETAIGNGDATVVLYEGYGSRSYSSGLSGLDSTRLIARRSKGTIGLRHADGSTAKESPVNVTAGVDLLQGYVDFVSCGYILWRRGAPSHAFQKDNRMI